VILMLINLTIPMPHDKACTMKALDYDWFMSIRCGQSFDSMKEDATMTIIHKEHTGVFLCWFIVPSARATSARPTSVVANTHHSCNSFPDSIAISCLIGGQHDGQDVTTWPTASNILEQYKFNWILHSQLKYQ